MTNFIRSICGILCLVLLASMLLSCSDEKKEKEEYFVLNSSAYAIAGEDSISNSRIREALQAINGACETFCGESLHISDDWYRDVMERHDVEVLVGLTNRPESISVAENLTYLDYSYEVLSPNVVVICGGGEEATRNAVNRFLSDCYGYEHKKSAGQMRKIPVGTSYAYRHEYTVKSVQLCNGSIDSYSIVCKSSSEDVSAAVSLRQAFARICGLSLPILTVGEYREGNAIFVGMGSTDGAHANRNYGETTYAAFLEETETGKHLFLDSTVEVDRIVAAFIDRYLTNISKEELKITISDLSLTTLLRNADNHLSCYTISEDEEIGTGVVYRELSYRDEFGDPVQAYVIEADLSKVSVMNATPNNGEETVNVKATTEEALRALTAAGYSVLAGVNGDHFNANNGYTPRGLCIKNGKVLHDVSGRPWFGITEDGTPVTGTAGEYENTYRGKLVEAVGGTYVFLRNGRAYESGKDSMGYYEDLASTRHPRTCVGYTDDGRLFLVVVDGRSEKSNGASLVDLVKIMLDLGATNAVTLDGGGSSTMVTYKNGNCRIHNTPSDGSLRSVYNSVALVEK